MAASTNATGNVPSSKGVLRPEELAAHVTFREVDPTPATAHWVERVWSVTWDLGSRTTTTSTLPHPAVSLTAERGSVQRQGRGGDGVWLTGVVTTRFDVLQSGRGGAVGIKFRPGGFTALTGIDSSGLTDRVVRAATLLEGVDVLAPAPLDAEAAKDAFCDWVQGIGAHEDPGYDLVRRAVEMLADPTLTRVDELAEELSLSVRTLQRVLRRYVGVGPKWLLRRHRLHDAVAALDEGREGSLADLAAGLGWYDQNQFARDFGAVVGVSPSAYRDRPRSSPVS